MTVAIKYGGFNGAMPFQAWISSPAENTVEMNRVASMGPCPFRHGYIPVAKIPSLPATSFNGAMPFRAWISDSLSVIGTPSQSFNGAMPFQAWISLPHPVVPPQKAGASMGPCPFRHGYFSKRHFLRL